eukprot:3398215-Amphidinium_carterae.1
MVWTLWITSNLNVLALAETRVAFTSLYEGECERNDDGDQRGSDDSCNHHPYVSVYHRAVIAGLPL